MAEREVTYTVEFRGKEYSKTVTITATDCESAEAIVEGNLKVIYCNPNDPVEIKSIECK